MSDQATGHSSDHARAGGAVALYCGHMFTGGSEAETELARRVRETLERLAIVAGYGPLACGADIVIAEALLARGAQLNVVLPFAEEDFIAWSVTCGGDGWLDRYRACRDAAQATHFATTRPYRGDDRQFAFATLYAAGLALKASEQRGCEAVQIAVVSDRIASLSPTGLAGTRADMRMWQSLGGESVTIAAGDVPRDLLFPPSPADGTR